MADIRNTLQGVNDAQNKRDREALAIAAKELIVMQNNNKDLLAINRNNKQLINQQNPLHMKGGRARKVARKKKKEFGAIKGYVDYDDIKAGTKESKSDVATTGVEHSVAGELTPVTSVTSVAKNNTTRHYKKHRSGDGRDYFESVEVPGTTLWELPEGGVVVEL